MKITVSMDTAEIVASVPRNEKMDLILDLDKSISEVGFTCDLIKMLLTSLKSDMTQEEIHVEFYNSIRIK